MQVNNKMRNSLSTYDFLIYLFAIQNARINSSCKLWRHHITFLCWRLMTQGKITNRRDREEGVFSLSSRKILYELNNKK